MAMKEKFVAAKLDDGVRVLAFRNEVHPGQIYKVPVYSNGVRSVVVGYGRCKVVRGYPNYCHMQYRTKYAGTPQNVCFTWHDLMTQGVLMH